MRGKITAKLRDKVANRANGCCEYCMSQENYAVFYFSIDHIHPVSKGGDNSLGNLAYACQGCNTYKYNKTAGEDPISNLLIRLYHPRKDRWSDHFAWNYDYSEIYGTSPVGRVTVRGLQLNRPTLVNLRRVLYEQQLHPPLYNQS